MRTRLLIEQGTLWVQAYRLMLTDNGALAEVFDVYHERLRCGGFSMFALQDHVVLWQN